MSTTPVGETKPENWKWIAGLLAVIVAILAITVSVESYRLYRPFHNHLMTSIPMHSIAPSSQLAPFPANIWNARNGIFVTGTPWDQLGQLHQRMNQLFNDAYCQLPTDNMASMACMSAVNSPNLDIRDQKDHYTVTADMPGADKTSIKVNVEGRLLTISGQRTSNTETKDTSGKVVQSERSAAEFVRAVELPGPVKAEAVDAKYDNGILTINLPKAEPSALGTQVTIH